MTTATANTTTRFVYEIREQRYEEMVALFAKYCRRTRKTLTAPPTFAVIFERDEERPATIMTESGLQIDGDKTVWDHYLYVTVEGQIPQVDGWQFIATIDHSEGDNLIRSVPGVGNLPVEIRSALPVCHHCNTARRRIETFILRNAEGELRQVGRNCLADFFPHGVAEAMASLEALAEAVALASASDDEEGYGGGRGKEYFGLESMLTLAAQAIDAFGWTSATKANADEMGAQSTAMTIREILSPPRDRDPKEIKAFRAEKATDKQVAEAEAALAWARAIDPTIESDYLYNIRTACQGECFPGERLGLIVSIIPTYRRAMSRAEELERQAKNPSQHIGTIGKRDVFKAMTCVKVGVPSHGQYGVSTLLMFRDENSNIMKWFASNDGRDWIEGEVYDLVATPKSHGEYRGQKETLVSRVAEWDSKWKAKK